MKHLNVFLFEIVICSFLLLVNKSNGIMFRLKSKTKSDDEITLSRLKEEISNSQSKMKSYREQLEQLLEQAENLPEISNNKNQLKEKIKYTRDNLIDESKKIRNKINAYLKEDDGGKNFPKFKQKMSDQKKENLEEAKKMLREIADNLTLTEDDYFVDKNDSLVYSYLKKEKDRKKRLDSIEIPAVQIKNETDLLSENIHNNDEYPDIKEKFNEIKKSADKKEDCLHIMNLFDNLLDQIDEVDPIKIVSSSATINSFGLNYLPSSVQQNSSLFDISMLLDDDIENKAKNSTRNTYISKSNLTSLNSNSTVPSEIKHKKNVLFKNNTLITNLSNITKSFSNNSAHTSNCTMNEDTFQKDLNLHKILLETRNMKNVLVTLYLQRKLKKLQDMKQKEFQKKKNQPLPPVFNSKEIAKANKVKSNNSYKMSRGLYHQMPII